MVLARAASRAAPRSGPHVEVVRVRGLLIPVMGGVVCLGKTLSRQIGPIVAMSTVLLLMWKGGRERGERRRLLGGELSLLWRGLLGGVQRLVTEDVRGRRSGEASLSDPRSLGVTLSRVVSSGLAGGALERRKELVRTVERA